VTPERVFLPILQVEVVGPQRKEILVVVDLGEAEQAQLLLFVEIL
jgi:hypothetical protein